MSRGRVYLLWGLVAAKAYERRLENKPARDDDGLTFDWKDETVVILLNFFAYVFKTGLFICLCLSTMPGQEFSETR